VRIKNKHPVLLNECHYNFVHSFVTLSFARNINDLLFHFLFLTIKRSLIDFIFFTRQYPWRNSKTNGRSSSNILIRCNQSVTTCRLPFRKSLCIATITVSDIVQQFGRLAKFIGYSCVENNELYFLPFSPPPPKPGSDTQPVSCGLATKITTINVKLKVDKYKNVTRSTASHSNATS
jgi:hypothetical protein